jgi:hypothetical protein
MIYWREIKFKQVFFFGGIVLGIQLRATYLLDGLSTTLAMPPAIFVLAVSEIGSHFSPMVAWTAILLFMFPCRTGMTGTYQRCLAIGWDGILQTFHWAGLKLSQSISTSQVARIIGLSTLPGLDKFLTHGICKNSIKLHSIQRKH